MQKYSMTVYFQIPDSSVPIRKTFTIEAQHKEEAESILQTMVRLYKERLEGAKKPSEIVLKLKSVNRETKVDEKLIRLLKGAFKK